NAIFYHMCGKIAEKINLLANVIDYRFGGLFILPAETSAEKYGYFSFRVSELSELLIKHPH
ncbi:hypothetical protein, partial [Limosilactobacillus vaginalis]|uniref:hypothetical protein n=1 Tax=Limosilactobacillus vaginalis TaxID=1633 RepID=UPI0025A4B36F